MKVAMYYSQGDIRIEEVDKPRIEEDEILVQMKACGLCGSDLMDWYLEPKAPLVLGHEPAGVIVDKGKKVKGFEIGDRVFAHHHVACMTCHYCLNGDYTLCKEFHETHLKPGGFAEFFAVPSPNLRLDTLKIPDTMSFEQATLIEPVGCCVRALTKCRTKVGDSVAIVGAGPTGLIHTSLAKIYGASQVIVSDLIDFRLELAKSLGADVVVNSGKESMMDAVKRETDGRGVDLAIVTAPNLNAYRTGVDVCRKGGKLCVFAPTSPKVLFQLSLKEMFFSELQLIPSYSTSHVETRVALELLCSRKICLDRLITHRFRLEDASRAFQTALAGKNSLKVLVLNE